jgi:hypothetical protein
MSNSIEAVSGGGGISIPIGGIGGGGMGIIGPPPPKPGIPGNAITYLDPFTFRPLFTGIGTGDLIPPPFLAIALLLP